MTKEFNSLDEIQKYYDVKSNTYIFKEDGKYIDLVVFKFDLDTSANIDAGSIDGLNIWAKNIRACDIDTKDLNTINIEAWDIYARDIYACNIEADNIKARNISYFAVCFAYDNIKCKSIQGERENAKHFVLDGKLEIEE